LNYRILIFNAAKKRFQVEEIEEDYIGPLSASVHIHLNRYKSYDLDVFDPNNVICLGASILAGMGISAFNDLVISFKSPLTGGLYINNVPGLGSSLSKLNVDLIVLEGKSKAPIIIGLRGKEDGGVECYIRYLEENQVISLMETYLRLRGTKALVRYVAEKILNWFMGSEGIRGVQRYWDRSSWYHIIVWISIDVNYGSRGDRNVLRWHYRGRSRLSDV